MSGPALRHPHRPTEEQLGGQLMDAVGEYLARDKSFHAKVANQHPLTFRAFVNNVQRNNSGLNMIQITRPLTGGQLDNHWYPVYATMYVPKKGDDVIMLWTDPGKNAVCLGGRGGGRPNQHTIAASGGSVRKYDASGTMLDKAGDDHHKRHYRTSANGNAIGHHHHEAGHHRHLGDHHHNATSLADDGTPTGGHRKTHQNGQYEHHILNGTSDQRLRHHHPTNGEGFYDTDGNTLRHYHLMGGAHKHAGDHYHNHSGINSDGSDGTGSSYHRHTHNNSQYEHWHGTTRLRSHHGTSGEIVYDAATGNTTLHHRETASGHHRHTGDHLHSVNSMDGSGNPTGPWLRHSRNGGSVYQRFLHDGTREWTLLNHDPNNGHVLWDNTTPPGQRVAHHHHPTGHAKHLGDKYHNVNSLDSAGNPTGPYVRHSRGGGTSYQRWLHDGTTLWQLLNHDSAQGHALLDNSTPSQKVVHHHHPNGTGAHAGALVHSAILAINGALSGNYHVHQHNNGQYEHLYQAQRLRGHHPANGEAVYDSTGLVVKHHRNPSGHSKAVGDLYQNTNALDGSGNPTGPWVRHSRGANSYQRWAQDGTREWQLLNHDPASGHALYDQSTPSQKVAHHHHPTGHAKHIGDKYHNVAALDTSGNPTAPYQRHTFTNGGYAHYHGTQQLRSHHPLNGEMVYKTDGLTVLHLREIARGHQGYTGDQYLSVSSISTVGAMSAPWIRHTRNAAVNHRLERYINTGTGDNLAMTQDIVAGHNILDGTNVKHHHNVNGDHKHTGDQYHNAGTVDASGNLGGLYHRHTHQNGQYEQQYSDGTTLRRLRSHHPANGEIVWNTVGNAALHWRDLAGHQYHAGDQYFAYGGLGTGNSATLTGKYHRKTISGDTYQHNQNLNDLHGERVVHARHATGGHFDYTDDGNNTGTMINIVKRGRNGTGGFSQYKQHGGTLFHTLGDDGTGFLHGRHANGNKAWDHDGSAYQAYANNVPVHRIEASSSNNSGVIKFRNGDVSSGPTAWHYLSGDGNQVFMHIAQATSASAFNDYPIWSHDGFTHTIHSQGFAYWLHQLTSTANKYGGQFLCKAEQAAAAYHLWGDDGTNKVHMKHGPTGNRVMDHDGSAYQAYANNVPVHRIEASSSNNSGVIKFRNGNYGGTGPSAAWHVLSGDANQVGLQVMNVVGGSTLNLYTAYVHDGSTMYHYANKGALAHVHNGTASQLYSSGQVAHQHDNNGYLAYIWDATHSQNINYGGLGRWSDGYSGGVFKAAQKVAAPTIPGFHLWGDDGTGNVHIKHASGNLALAHSGSLFTAYGAGGNKAWDHNGQTHQNYYNGTVVHKMAPTAENNGFALHVYGSTKGANGFMEWGYDPVAGSGYRIKLHNGNYGHAHDGLKGRHFAPNAALSANYEILQSWSTDPFATNTSGGRMLIKPHNVTISSASAAAAQASAHGLGDDSSGNHMEYGYGQLYKYTNNNSTSRKFTYSNDVFFGTNNQNHDYNTGGSSEVWIVPQGVSRGTAGGGALKQGSHSITYTFDHQTGQALANATTNNTIPSGSTPGGGQMADVAARSGGANNAPLFNTVNHCIWVSGNPGIYSRGVPNFYGNYGWGTGTYTSTGGAYSGYAAWSAIRGNADTSFTIYGASYNSPGSWSADRTTLYVQVN